MLLLLMMIQTCFCCYYTVDCAAVKRNREGLGEVMKQLQQDIQQKQKALQAYIEKYKIRPAGPGDDEDEPSSSSKPKSKQGSSSGGSSSKGVLA